MRTKGKLLITLVIVFVMSLTAAAFGMTAFAAPVQEDTMHAQFAEQWGDWVQYRNTDNGEGDQQLAALALKSLMSAPGTNVDSKAFIVSDKLSTAESFSITFETAVPFADDGTRGSVGFFARETVDPNTQKVSNNMGGFLIELFKDNMRIVYNNPTIAVAAGSAFSQAVTQGEFVKVAVTVEGDNVTAKLYKSDGTEISSATATSGVKFAAGLKAGFSVEATKPIEGGKFAGTYAIFRNIVYTAGNETYKAYPFEAASVNPSDVPPTAELDPNFAVTSGAFLGAENGSFVKATSLHATFTNAAMISTFGGVYGENFDLTFDINTPTQQEVDATGEDKKDANSGFYFRASTSNDLYSGIYIRVEYSSIMIVNGKDSSGKLDTKSYFFGQDIPYGTTLTMHINVASDTITVDIKNGSTVVPLKETADATTTVNSVSAKANIKYDESLVAGFACDKMLGRFANIVMKNGDASKQFLAYPFDPNKTIPEEYKNFTVVGEGMRKVSLKEDSDDVLDSDKDIVGAEFEYILYAQYDGKPHDISLALESGGEMTGFTAKFEYRLPPDWEYHDWCESDSHKTDVNRHGMSVTVLDADGYAYARQLFAYKIYAVEVELEGVEAVDRAYDGTMSVQLTGGALKGVLAVDQDKVSFTLGVGTIASPNVGTDVAVTVDAANVQLTGDKAGNYTLKLPEGLTVNITKGKAEAPEGELYTEARTENSITVAAIYNAEYSIDGTTWQDSNVFENLESGKEYTIYARIKGNDNQEASDPVSITERTEGGASGGCSGQVAFSTGAVAVLLLGIVLVAVSRRKRED